MNQQTELFKSAQTRIPGGVNSPVRAFKSVGGTPIFFEHASGPYVYDIEGNRYVDYVGSWGPMILGHADPIVTQAVQKAVSKSLSFGAPTPVEVAMAQLITDMMPNLAMVRMVNSGTEAAMTAIRLARGYTQRSLIIKFIGGYHGHSDSLLAQAGSGLLTFSIPSSAGVPDSFTQATLLAHYNDIDSVATLFKAHGKNIAGVIVEPVAGNMNCIPPEPGFLQGLRNLCTEHQSLLIFDEVITGFRVALGGAQALYNIEPDLTCLGKIIGGGMPVGAIGGSKAIMEYLAPTGPVYQAGTLSGNPICMTAGYHTLLQLKNNPGLYAQLEQQTHSLLKGLEQIAAQHEVPMMTQQVGSLFGLFFTPQAKMTHLEQVKTCNVAHFNQFFHAMLKEGVYFAPSAFESGFVSTTHSQAILEQTWQAADKAFSEVRSKTTCTA